MGNSCFSNHFPVFAVGSSVTLPGALNCFQCQWSKQPVPAKQGFCYKVRSNDWHENRNDHKEKRRNKFVEVNRPEIKTYIVDQAECKTGDNQENSADAGYTEARNSKYFNND